MIERRWKRRTQDFVTSRSANCTIDRGSWRNTVLGEGCKLDNLVRSRW